MFRIEDLGKKLFMIAEIGAAHDGNPQIAHDLIDRMAEAGADAVKFQTYTPDILLADQERVVEWGAPGNRHREKAGDMFRRVMLPREAHAELFAHAREKGLIPFTTIFDPADLDFVMNLQPEVIKISSGDVNYMQLLDAVAGTGLPLIISGGKCTAEEFDRAIKVLRSKQSPVHILHCVATYPAPVEDANLLQLNYYRKQYPGSGIGFSDHTQGIGCACAAVALGARIIEKHVTYSQKAFGPDHWFSSDFEEFRQLTQECRRIEKALGTEKKKISPSEIQGARMTRRSVIAARDIPKGETLTLEDLCFLRPGTGIDPFETANIIGRKLKQAVEKSTPLTWELIE